MKTRLQEIATDINLAADYCNEQAIKGGWWHDLETGKPKERNKGEMLMLMVSEIAEAMEAVRKNKMDDHLPNRKGEGVELADCVIRIMDYCANYGLDLGGCMAEKIAYNAQRADHKPENRKLAGGKAF